MIWLESRYTGIQRCSRYPEKGREKRNKIKMMNIKMYETPHKKFTHHFKCKLNSPLVKWNIKCVEAVVSIKVYWHIANITLLGKTDFSHSIFTGFLLYFNAPDIGVYWTFIWFVIELMARVKIDFFAPKYIGMLVGNENSNIRMRTK